jgi:hypothetical protein
VLLSDNLLLSGARSLEPTASIALSTGEIDTVTTLNALARVIVEHNQRLSTGEPVDWEAVTDLLSDAERACRQLRSSKPSSYSTPAAVTRLPTEPPDTSPIYS